MSDQLKKQTFLQGTALLALANVIVKVIGAVYKIPLNAIIGEQGFGYFSTAYEIYAVLLMVSTAGLPVAMSRMISEASAQGRYNQVRRIYATARGIFLGLGLAGALLMTVFCRQLAAFQNQPDAWAAIGCLGPSMLLICTMSSFRGFFQGQSNMLPTSVSQVIEATVKLVVGMIAAIALLKLTNSVPLAAGGAILGVTVSCLVSVIYLRSCFAKAYRALPVTGEEVTSYGATAKMLLAIAVPITIGSASLQLLTMMETKIYMGRLLNLGYLQSEADTMRGIYSMTQTIFNMPCSFIYPITIPIIPAITALLTTGDHKGAQATGESASRVTGLVCMPCAIGLAVMAEPITALLGGYEGEKLALATTLMTILGISIIFNAVVLLTNAMMQAHGHPTIPVVNVFIGGLCKLGIVFMLTGNPAINIMGAPVGTVCCYLIITILNLMSMKRAVPHPPAVIRNLLRPFLAAALMGGCVWGVWWVLKTVVGITSSLILCALPVMVGVVVYAFAAIALKAITREDCMLLPKGEKIAKILHL